MSGGYDYKEVRRLYALSLSHDNIERMTTAQRLEELNRVDYAQRARRLRHQYRKFCSASTDLCPCIVPHPSALTTYDDWGDGPQCVRCGRLQIQEVEK